MGTSVVYNKKLMEKEIESRVEVMGDYDGILYHKYTDWTMMNVHTNVFFDETRTKEEYGFVYQFMKGKLVWLSRYKAEGLNIKNNLSLVENELWWTRWKTGRDELIYRPLKDMSYLHIKAILADLENGRQMRIEPRILAYFKSIKEIDNDIIKAGKPES